MGFEIINTLKKEKGLTNAQIAKMSGITLSTLDKITSGVNTNPKLDTLQAICKVLGCTLDDFSDQPANKKIASPYSEEALKLAGDYDGLDRHGKRVVRLVADEEKARCEDDQQAKAAALRESREQMEAAEKVPAPSEMPTPFYEGGLEDSADELMKYVRRLNPGQQRMILEQAEKMIAARKELVVSSVPPKGGNTPPESDSPTQS